jgi:hypothetical protein
MYEESISQWSTINYEKKYGASTNNFVSRVPWGGACGNTIPTGN